MYYMRMQAHGSRIWTSSSSSSALTAVAEAVDFGFGAGGVESASLLCKSWRFSLSALMLNDC